MRSPPFPPPNEKELSHRSGYENRFDSSFKMYTTALQDGGSLQ